MPSGGIAGWAGHQWSLLGFSLAGPAGGQVLPRQGAADGAGAGGMGREPPAWQGQSLSGQRLSPAEHPGRPRCWPPNTILRAPRSHGRCPLPWLAGSSSSSSEGPPGQQCLLRAKGLGAPRRSPGTQQGKGQRLRVPRRTPGNPAAGGCGGTLRSSGKRASREVQIPPSSSGVQMLPSFLARKPSGRSLWTQSTRPRCAPPAPH